uniref:ABC transmembrane type-1 domain-containing protein n=1 Tax=Aegilops tauschii subsp. strangulata TaxID=200361 RepID=A0A453SGB0_AEGTS
VVSIRYLVLSSPPHPPPASISTNTHKKGAKLHQEKGKAGEAMALSSWSMRLPYSPSRPTLNPRRSRLLFSPSVPILNPRPSRLPATSHVADSGRRRCLRLGRPPHAYISAPAPGPDAYQSPSFDAAEAAADVAAAISSTDAITWAGVWALLSQHKARLAISLAALLACTTSTLSMPLFSGRFFETLIGRGSEPLTRLLSKIAVLYTLEPIFTIVFVINMTVVWEKVMGRLRSQIFRRILIQKMVFFDRHKVL